MPTDPNIPLILMRNLPVSTATVTADYTFVAVAGNRNTVRVPWSTLSAGFITVSPAIPAGPTSEGTEGQLAWDSTGVYTYTNGAWGKSPRVGVDWGDLTNDARFLLVNKVMSLTDVELANVLKTLGIGFATKEKAGLVKLATTMDENLGNVPTTAQVVDYVTEQLKEIEIGGGGGDKISAYQGGVDIKGPNGELILTYDATERILHGLHHVSKYHSWDLGRCMRLGRRSSSSVLPTGSLLASTRFRRLSVRPSTNRTAA
jgi:hypothetical protein